MARPCQIAFRCARTLDPQSRNCLTRLQSFYIFRRMDWITDPQIWISLLTLTLLEIVLGVDNIIFISILAGKLPPDQQARARRAGLMLALITRVILLLGLAWIVRLEKPFVEFTVLSHHVGISGRDLILILGGLFLLAKSTHEIHDKLEGEDGEVSR